MPSRVSASCAAALELETIRALRRQRIRSIRPWGSPKPGDPRAQGGDDPPVESEGPGDARVQIRRPQEGLHDRRAFAENHPPQAEERDQIAEFAERFAQAEQPRIADGYLHRHPVQPVDHVRQRLKPFAIQLADQFGRLAFRAA
jgi:hypothetical protein